MNPLTLLAIALAISLGGNAFLGHAYLGARDDRTQANADRDSARTAANQCSASVEGLAKEAQTRAKENEAQVAAALAVADAANKRADTLKRAKPKFAGDDCKSAAAQVDDWLNVRGAKR